MPSDPRSTPLSDADRERLEGALDALPPPLEALDISALDGFLVGVLLQPERPPPEAWLRWVFDVEGRSAPPAATAAAGPLILRRYRELDRAIGARRWFDPWVFELEAGSGEDEDEAPSQAVLPWIAGFAAALDRFGGLLALGDEALREPLATLYAYFDPEDLEDVDDLRALIDQSPPPEDLAEAVEDLVRCSLLLADVSRPLPAPPAAAKRKPRAS